MPTGPSGTLDCIGVHWDTDLKTAEKQFFDWGFREITHFRKVQGNINGNTARDKAQEIAEEQFPAVRAYWVGSFDANWTAGDSALYRFTYGEYIGPRTEVNVFHADYDGHSGQNQ